MRESCMYGSVRGARGNSRPYRDRREFITLSSAAFGRPLAARAQQPSLPKIGVLCSKSPSEEARLLARFRQGLNEIGYVEGHNVAIEYRWAENQNDRLQALAADLVRRQVAVIATPGSHPATLAAKAATTTIPIVFTTSGDPIALGLVAHLSRPGGNMTGVTSMGVELGPKQLEVLRELVPTATTMALLINPGSPAIAESTTKQVQAAARTLGLNLQVVHASTELDFDTVFATLIQRAGGLVIGPDAFFTARAEELGALALRHRVPAIYQYPEFTAAGGLMSYGASLTDMYRQAGVYVGLILKGEKPADLPVRQATRVELIVNLKTGAGTPSPQLPGHDQDERRPLRRSRCLGGSGAPQGGLLVAGVDGMAGEALGRSSKAARHRSSGERSCSALRRTRHLCIAGVTHVWLERNLGRESRPGGRGGE
jgi:putative tryptophan/tyrosine transport system substrate-binding protein